MRISPPELSTGDMVEVGVTHEIVVDGEKSWVKYGVSSKVQDNETSEDARARVAKHVNEGVMKTVMETVAKVRSTE